MVVPKPHDGRKNPQRPSTVRIGTIFPVELDTSMKAFSKPLSVGMEPT